MSLRLRQQWAIVWVVVLLLVDAVRTADPRFFPNPDSELPLTVVDPVAVMPSGFDVENGVLQTVVTTSSGSRLLLAVTNSGEIAALRVGTGPRTARSVPDVPSAVDGRGAIVGLYPVADAPGNVIAVFSRGILALAANEDRVSVQAFHPNAVADTSWTASWWVGGDGSVTVKGLDETGSLNATLFVKEESSTHVRILAWGTATQSWVALLDHHPLNGTQFWCDHGVEGIPVRACFSSVMQSLEIDVYDVSRSRKVRTLTSGGRVSAAFRGVSSPCASGTLAVSDKVAVRITLVDNEPAKASLSLEYDSYSWILSGVYPVCVWNGTDWGPVLAIAVILHPPAPVCPSSVYMFLTVPGSSSITEVFQPNGKHVRPVYWSTVSAGVADKYNMVLALASCDPGDPTILIYAARLRYEYNRIYSDDPQLKNVGTSFGNVSWVDTASVNRAEPTVSRPLLLRAAEDWSEWHWFDVYSSRVVRTSRGVFAPVSILADGSTNAVLEVALLQLAGTLVWAVHEASALSPHRALVPLGAAQLDRDPNTGTTFAVVQNGTSEWRAVALVPGDFPTTTAALSWELTRGSPKATMRGNASRFVMWATDIRQAAGSTNDQAQWFLSAVNTASQSEAMALHQPWSSGRVTAFPPVVHVAADGTQTLVLFGTVDEVTLTLYSNLDGEILQSQRFLAPPAMIACAARTEVYDEQNRTVLFGCSRGFFALSLDTLLPSHMYVVADARLSAFVLVAGGRSVATCKLADETGREVSVVLVGADGVEEATALIPGTCAAGPVWSRRGVIYILSEVQLKENAVPAVSIVRLSQDGLQQPAAVPVEANVPRIGTQSRNSILLSDSEQLLLVLSSSQTVWVMDLVDGGILWSHPTLSLFSLGSAEQLAVAGARNVVWAWSSLGAMMALDVFTGRVLWVIDLQDHVEAFLAGPTLLNGTMADNRPTFAACAILPTGNAVPCIYEPVEVKDVASPPGFRLPSDALFSSDRFPIPTRPPVPPPPPPPDRHPALIVGLLLGAGVAVGLGVYAVRGFSRWKAEQRILAEEAQLVDGYPCAHVHVRPHHRSHHAAPPQYHDVEMHPLTPGVA